MFNCLIVRLLVTLSWYFFLNQLVQQMIQEHSHSLIILIRYKYKFFFLVACCPEEDTIPEVDSSVRII